MKKNNNLPCYLLKRRESPKDRQLCTNLEVHLFIDSSPTNCLCTIDYLFTIKKNEAWKHQPKSSIQSFLFQKFTSKPQRQTPSLG